MLDSATYFKRHFYWSVSELAALVMIFRALIEGVVFYGSLGEVTVLFGSWSGLVRGVYSVILSLYRSEDCIVTVPFTDVVI